MSWGEGEYTDDEVKDMIDSGNAYVATLGKELIGVFLLQWEDDNIWDNPEPNAGYIHRLVIKEGFHGKNLGAQLINWAANEALKNGKHFLRLDCTTANKKLCAYYENQGFKLVATKDILDYKYTAALYQRIL